MPTDSPEDHALTDYEEDPGALQSVGSIVLQSLLGVLGFVAAWLLSCLPLIASVGFSSGYLGFLVWSILLVLAVEDFFDLDLVGEHKLYRRAEDRPERLLVGEDGEEYIGEQTVGMLMYDMRHSLSVPKRRRALWIARIRLLLPALVLAVSDILVWSAGNTIFSPGWTPEPLKVIFGIIWFIWFGHELMVFGGKRTRATRGMVAQQLLAARGEAHQGDLTVALRHESDVDAGALSLSDENHSGALSVHDNRD